MIQITKLGKCNRKYKTKGGHMRTVHDSDNKAKKMYSQIQDKGRTYENSA